MNDQSREFAVVKESLTSGAVDVRRALIARLHEIHAEVVAALGAAPAAPEGKPFVGAQCPSCGEEFVASAAPAAADGTQSPREKAFRAQLRGHLDQLKFAAWQAAIAMAPATPAAGDFGAGDFAAYLRECDRLAIQPDTAGAFHAGWQAALSATDHSEDARGMVAAPATVVPEGMVLVSRELADSAMQTLYLASNGKENIYASTAHEFRDVLAAAKPGAAREVPHVG